MVWAEDWSDDEIRVARDRDRRRKREYYGSLGETTAQTTTRETLADRRDKNVITKFWNWIRVRVMKSN